MNKNYFLHRISHEATVSYPLLDNYNYLSIGWSIYRDSDILNAISNAGEEGFNAFMNEHNNTRRSRWNLWYFSQFQVGDIIVVPRNEQEFGIYEVIQNPSSINSLKGLIFKNTSQENVEITEKGLHLSQSNTLIYDIGFIVKVKELVRLDRNCADSRLTARMKIRQATVRIDNIKTSVEDALSRQAPINIHDELQNTLSENVKKIIADYITPQRLEKLIVWYMKKIGADEVYIPPKNESNKQNGADADIIASFHDLQVTFYIQAKKHSGLTDDWGVHQIKEYLLQKKKDNDGYTYIPWVISTATFTDEAIAKARDDFEEDGTPITPIRLIGGDEFACMLMDQGFKNINSIIN